MRPATLISTVVAAAADTDLTDLATVKSELAIAGTANDKFLARQIAAASAAIQTYCNRVFAAQTIQDQIWFARESWPAVVREGAAPLQLTGWPLLSVASVVAPVLGVGTTLQQGTDFLADMAAGQLVRLDANGFPKHWRESPIVATYQAGYADLPADVEEATILLVKMRWFARLRDPLTRSLNAPGVFEQTFVMGTGPGGADDMPAEVTALIDRYRVPVVA
jgi:hypothetical protein